MKNLPIKNFEVEGTKYQTILLPARVAMPVDRQVVGMLNKAFGDADLGDLFQDVPKPSASTSEDSPKEASPKKKLDPAKGMKILGTISGAIASLTDEEFDRLVSVSLSQTTALGSTPQERDVLLDGDGIDAHFRGRYAELYQVLFEVWRANQLSPFGVLSRFGVQI